MESPGFEWFRFYNGGDGLGVTSKPVCRLHGDLVREIGSGTDRVMIGLDYVRKSVNKHRLGFDHFPMMEMAIRFGDAYRDQKGLSFFYQDHIAFSPLFFVGVKTANGGRELYTDISPEERD